MSDDDSSPWRPPAEEPSSGWWSTPPPGPPQAGPVWASPNPYVSDGAPNPFGDDTLSSPPPRRHGAVVALVVAVVALAAVGGVVLVALNIGHGTASPGQDIASTSAPTAQQPPSSPRSAEPSQSASASAPPPVGGVSTGPLDSYLLAPTDLGPSTQMVLIPGGRDAVTQATLDLCDYHYASEAQRSARVQVEYIDGAAPVSNEFVKYGPGGARAAYDELTKALASCPVSYSESGGVTVSQVHQLASTPNLVTESKVVSILTTTAQGPLWTGIIYQFDGDYFSGVYAYGVDEATTLHVAEQLGVEAAQHLREATAGKAGTGGGIVGGSGSGSGGGAQV